MALGLAKLVYGEGLVFKEVRDSRQKEGVLPLNKRRHHREFIVFDLAYDNRVVLDLVADANYQVV
ncbi:hypothetical protein [Ralstonia pseudosolanacearum]|nr:hypothetical protein [Ralstonia pseudosolanacearum]